MLEASLQLSVCFPGCRRVVLSYALLCFSTHDVPAYGDFAVCCEAELWVFFDRNDEK